MIDGFLNGSLQVPLKTNLGQTCFGRVPTWMHKKIVFGDLGPDWCLNVFFKDG